MRNQYIVKGKTTTVFVEAPPDYEDGGFIDIIIDTDDLERVKSFPGSWYSFRHKHNDKIYVRGSKQQRIPPGFTSSQPLLHRVISKPTRGENVTFVDGNSFNCCKKNLVNIPIGQVYKPHLDPYRLPIVQGVHWRKDKQRFEVKAYYGRKGYYLGLYALEDWEAANKAVSVFREIGPEEYFKRYKKRHNNILRKELIKMDIKERIEQAQAKLKQAEQAKTVAETQLESAKKECDDIIEQMEALDVTPENIDAVISQLETEVDSDLTAIEQAIPTVQ